MKRDELKAGMAVVYKRTKHSSWIKGTLVDGKLVKGRSWQLDSTKFIADHAPEYTREVRLACLKTPEQREAEVAAYDAKKEEADRKYAIENAPWVARQKAITDALTTRGVSLERVSIHPHGAHLPLAALEQLLGLGEGA